MVFRKVMYQRLIKFSEKPHENDLQVQIKMDRKMMAGKTLMGSKMELKRGT